MPPQEAFTISETNYDGTNATKPPFLWSTRMGYALCAFLSMVLHHCMRSAVNFSILCMVSSKHYDPRNLNIQEINEQRSCESLNNNDTDAKRIPYGDLDWTRNQEVMFQGLFYYGYIVTLPIGGLITDRYGGKICFVYSLVVEAVLFMLIPICARFDFWLASFIRVLQGLTAGFGNPALYSLFTIWAHPTERTAALAFGYSGFNVGNLIVFPLCSYLCKLGWDYVFYIIGGFSFFIGLTFHFFVYNSIESHPRISKREYEYLKSGEKPKSAVSFKNIPWLAILKSFPVYVFIITHFTHTFGVSMEALMLSRYLKEAMHFPLRHVGNISAIIFLGALLSKIITVALSLKLEKLHINHTKYQRLVHLSCNLCAMLLAVVVAFLSCRERWIIVVLWTTVSILTDVAFALAYWPSIMTLAPSYTGFLIGIANCFGTTSALFIPIVIARVAPYGTTNEWQHVIAIMSAMYLIDALTFGFFGTSELQPWGLHKEDENNENNAKK